MHYVIRSSIFLKPSASTFFLLAEHDEVSQWHPFTMTTIRMFMLLVFAEVQVSGKPSGTADSCFQKLRKSRLNFDFCSLFVNPPVFFCPFKIKGHRFTFGFPVLLHSYRYYAQIRESLSDKLFSFTKWWQN